MLRFFVFLLTATFCFNTVSIHASNFSHVQVRRCCCKTGICKCQHAGGKACPLQKNIQFKTQNHADQKIPFLIAFGGCGSQEEKSQLPESLKHYFNFMEENFSFASKNIAYLHDRHDSFQFLFDHRFKRPPRSFKIFIPNLI